jgi:hypothetical protein
MKMQIDFYSKEELSIQIDTSGNMSFPEVQTSELFLFASYTLRQLRNLGQHLVAKCLTGFLVSDANYHNLMSKDYEIGTADSLLQTRDWHILMSQPKGEISPQQIVLSRRLTEERLSINPTFIEIFDRDYASKVPRITGFRGKGKKSFILTLLPFRLDLSGFGIFSTDANFYVFHSVISLIRYLLLEHENDEQFLKNINQVGMYCGGFHIADRIPADQATLAISILKTAGIAIN